MEVPHAAEGFSGVVCAVVPVDVQVQDTYHVLAHFHYVLVWGALFSIFGGVYYWLRKWTGHMYVETLGKWHFWLSMFFFNLTFFVQHFLGLAGMPRRIPDYGLQFADFNMISSIGAFGFGFSQLVPLRRVEVHPWRRQSTGQTLGRSEDPDERWNRACRITASRHRRSSNNSGDRRMLCTSRQIWLETPMFPKMWRWSGGWHSLKQHCSCWLRPGSAHDLLFSTVIHLKPGGVTVSAVATDGWIEAD